MRLETAILFSFTTAAYRPIVFWHGMGDSCCDGIDRLGDEIKKWLPGVYVHSVRIGGTKEEDRKAGYFDNLNRQVGFACGQLANDANLKNGFNAIGNCVTKYRLQPRRIIFAVEKLY